MLVSKLTTLLDKSLAINQSKQIHAQILINGFSDLEPLLVGRIIGSANHYSRKTTDYVKSIIHHMQNPDVFSMACTIRFLSQHGQFQEAVALYVQLHSSGLFPNTFAISSTLKACARILCKLGVMIHGQVHKYGFCKVVYVQTALVDFYSKMGHMDTARRVFDEIHGKNVVSWNSMLAGYVKSGDIAMAQCVFDEMPEKDVISWNSMVSGYTTARNMEQAYALFRQMPERNSASWNAMIGGYLDCGKIELARSFFDAMPQKNNVSYITMISGYSKCGRVEAAEELFGQMGEKDQFLYNAMIACYAQNSRAKEALQLFNEMLKPNVNIQPDKMTLASAISACSQLGDLNFGTWIESFMKEMGIVMDDHLATSFIDLYVKCGSIDKAYKLFHGLRKKDLVAYTAMILGCGINGRANDAIKLFEEMMEAEINPNMVTFTGILTAYNHVGLVEEAYHCFTSVRKYGLVPSVDHYAIVVDLLGRAGRLEEAHELIKSMPMQPHAGVWGALLLACSLHNNVELAEIAAKHCFELEPDSSGYCSLLANIYASVGKWADANRLRKAIEERGLIKVPGSSWMESAKT
ncbi:Pentatricopeptide repeat-containing protein [Abeliophyllum distichum]|uniref:Pentatricopeptide repeat-containing protein n=1 Tax=Abeliophyllum distichum TaxID=126358 RepID=A0ABD1VR85_9LAMI